MTHTEIKKALYKNKPKAMLTHIRNGIAYYHAFIEMELSGNSVEVKFEVPCGDMGEADFLPMMQAQYLIRWLI